HIALAKVSNLLWDSVEDNQFITAIYGILDETNKTFVFSNAGHNPPLLVKENGDFKLIEYGDMPLGIFRNMRYHQHFLRFDRGDLLVLYTDGIIEAVDQSGQEFGLERFIQKVIEGRNLSSKELIKFLEDSVRDFTGEEKPSDDMTLFIIKRSE
ncbi:MAG: PP2C family protein-serine/threonine phosphatase, partial [Pyrinomonadaceae bacterium]